MLFRSKFAEFPEEIGAKQHGMDEKSVGLIFAQYASPWKVYVDGAANQRGSRVGLVLVSPEKITIEKSLRLGFSATNNENIARFKTGRRPGKKGTERSGYKNAGIFGSS